MHDKDARPRLADLTDEVPNKRVVLGVAQTQTVLDSDGYAACFHHRAHAGGDVRRIGHEHGAEAAFLRGLARAAAVQVHFAVACILAGARALR